MTEAPKPDAPTVTDSRPVPSGVLPRGLQTWLMVGIAVGMVGVILFTGHSQPPMKTAATPSTPPVPNADRVREYQDRLRQLEAQAAQQALAESVAAPTPPPVRPEEDGAQRPAPAAPPIQDPVQADRKRREYESLFAGNVVLSRRPESQRPDPSPVRTSLSTPPARIASPDGSPSIDEIADAALRATARANQIVGAAGRPSASPPSIQERPPAPDARLSPRTERRVTDALSEDGPLHTLLEGTVIDTVLTNRLDGHAAAPLNCLVTNAVYSHGGQHVLIPAGARLLGESKPVQAVGDTRLAVSFHRLVMPDGRTYALNHDPGANQVGDGGLKDHVNAHYWSTFGAAAAVGLISGLSQFVGTAGAGFGDGTRTVVIAGGASDSTSQALTQAMSRFLNRLPTVTIQEGHRVKVVLTSDLELPAYAAGSAPKF